MDEEYLNGNTTGYGRTQDYFVGDLNDENERILHDFDKDYINAGRKSVSVSDAGEEALMQARIAQRRKKSLEIKRKRDRQLKMMRRCVAAGMCCIVAVAFIVTAITVGVRAIKGNVSSKLANNSVDEVSASPISAVEEETVAKKTYVYPTISSSYRDITDADVKSPYVALLSVEDNEIIAGRLADTKIYPASMTKVMTLLVAVENIKDLDNSYYTFKYDELNKLYLEDASVAGFLENERVSAREMLYGLVLPSGADAAVGLANLVAGSESEFAKLMNQKCEELGLKYTHFVNTSGLYDDEQYTTPVEMAIIMMAAMENEVCAQVLSTYQHTTAATTQHPSGIELTSTMFSRMYGTEVEGVVIQAGKTGYVDESKHCLVNYAEKDGKHYVCVMAQATNKWHCIFDSFAIYKNYLP
jgi:D-alanyl-D-alanine carboxypeptidase (penicillin-binding protein 5/6)